MASRAIPGPESVDQAAGHPPGVLAIAVVDVERAAAGLTAVDQDFAAVRG